MSDLEPTQLSLPVTEDESPSQSEPSPTVRRQPASKWFVVGVGSAGVFVGIVAMSILGRPSSSAPQPAAAADRDAAKAPAAIVEQAPLPTWLGSRTAGWSRDGSKTIEFELQASNEVPIWMTRIRPTLVVRCLSRTTEVFVLTGAASIEPQSGVHTVRLQIDDEETVLQHWSDSESRQELFAPNGVALTRQLANARRLRLGFTPYNASPVVADFVVEGFDELAGLVANTCGWKLGPTGERKAQGASSN
jgi:hypothetical protein